MLASGPTHPNSTEQLPYFFKSSIKSPKNGIFEDYTSSYPITFPRPSNKSTASGRLVAYAKKLSIHFFNESSLFPKSNILPSSLIIGLKRSPILSNPSCPSNFVEPRSVKFLTYSCCSRFIEKSTPM